MLLLDNTVCHLRGRLFFSEMHSSKETSYEMTARPAWMRADQREPLSRQTRIAGLVALTTLLLVTLYTFVDPTSIEAATQALSLVGKQPDVVWQTLGALDPHTQPVTSRNITSAATVAPFFIRARRAGTYDREDVTAFSMATSDRLDMLEMLAEQYQGAWIRDFLLGPGSEKAYNPQVRFLWPFGCHLQINKLAKLPLANCKISSSDQKPSGTGSTSIWSPKTASWNLIDGATSLVATLEQTMFSCTTSISGYHQAFGARWQIRRYRPPWRRGVKPSPSHALSLRMTSLPYNRNATQKPSKRFSSS